MGWLTWGLVRHGSGVVAGFLSGLGDHDLMDISSEGLPPPAVGLRPVSRGDRRIGVVVGTRAEAVKCAPVIRALADRHKATVRVVTTGQHHAAASEVLRLFGISADHALAPERAGTNQDLAYRAGRLQMRLAPFLSPEKADAVLVHGDTLSALAGALTAFLRQVPVIHLEAGLRTGDLASPFPEEGGRSVIGRVASLHLAPTARAAANLRAEGVPPGRVLVTGNTVVDAVRYAADHPSAREWSNIAGFGGLSLGGYLRRPGPLLIAGAHRRESWGAPLARIVAAVDEIAAGHPHVKVLVAAHPNPAVQAVWMQGLAERENVLVTGPLPYPVFARLLSIARLVITDSGGLQEEAPAFGTPVLVTRETTERIEGLESGSAVLAGTDPHRIVKEAATLLSAPDGQRVRCPYGDGHAAERAAAACVRFLATAL